MEKFTAVYQRVGEWWVGTVEELAGANSQGRSLDEVRENLREAVRLILEVNRELVREETRGCDVIREDLVLAEP